MGIGLLARHQPARGDVPAGWLFNGGSRAPPAAHPLALALPWLRQSIADEVKRKVALVLPVIQQRLWEPLSVMVLRNSASRKPHQRDVSLLQGMRGRTRDKRPALPLRDHAAVPSEECRRVTRRGGGRVSEAVGRGQQPGVAGLFAEPCRRALPSLALQTADCQKGRRKAHPLQLLIEAGPGGQRHALVRKRSQQRLERSVLELLLEERPVDGNALLTLRAFRAGRLDRRVRRSRGGQEQGKDRAHHQGRSHRQSPHRNSSRR